MPQTRIDNRYTLAKPLGSGGMARVYLAHDQLLGRDVALKILGDHYAENEEFVARFKREAQSAAILNHPNIVSVYDWGCSEDGIYYMALEYVTRGTLKEHIDDYGPLDSYVAAGLAYQVAQALGAAHQHGVIHRDVKPQNILLTDEGSVKVADFGIARAANATTISRTSFVVGTAAYMSPEQAKGEEVGPQSDLYSLGVVLYEMLTGALPYEAENPFAVAMKHVNEPARSPRDTKPSVPEPLDALTVKLLAKNPEDRCASAAELADTLERVRSVLLPLGMDLEETEKIGVTGTSDGKWQTRSTVIRAPSAAPIEAPRSDRKRRNVLAYVLAALTLGVILLGLLAWALKQDYGASEQSGSESTASSNETKPSIVRVPSLYYASEVESTLADVGLKLGNRTESVNDAVPSDVVIEQDPEAGTLVEEGATVDIVVSTGPTWSSPVQAATPAQPSAATPIQAATPAQPTAASSVHGQDAGKGKGKGKGKGHNK